MAHVFPQQWDRSSSSQHSTPMEALERLGAIGEFARCCVFVTSVSDGSIAGLTGVIDTSMMVFGNRLPMSPRGVTPSLRAIDLPVLKRQVAAALAGEPPVAYDYRYSGAVQGDEPRLRCLLKGVEPGDLPAGIEHPALIGVAHLMPADQTSAGRLAEARMFTDLFERWICATADQRAVVEEAIRISAEALRLVSANCQREVAAQMSDRDAEGLRLASDIHDGICQLLGTAAGTLSLVTMATDAGNPHQARTQLDLARSLVDEAMVESRSAISGLQPRGLDDVPLSVALRRLAEKTAPTAAIYLDIDEGVRLPESARGQVYRVAQEALANVHKHANATLVEVSLLDVGSDVQLLVRDDGCGFTTGGEESRGDGAFGLLSMKGRALALGARLDVASAPGSGTCIDLRTPGEPIQRPSRAG